MRTIIILVVLTFCIAALPGCASSKALSREEMEGVIERAIESQVRLPPGQWTNYNDVYERMMIAIIFEEQLDLAGIAPHRVDAAYRAIFPEPANPASWAWCGWIGSFADHVRWATKGWVGVIPGNADDPLFKKYKEKEWRVAHIFLEIRRRFEDGTQKISGIVVSAPEPKTELDPPLGQ
ncbi:hypothetical protein HY624_03945 [Candidatus Uhrbacteria bacterium]|nr:hypothetical protein [Candidatus Uhrbacteria bacterium]